MARTKKGEVSKSDAIRGYLADHKKAKAADVVAALAEQGIQVSTALIYALKGKGRSKRGRAKTTRGAPKTTPGNGKFSLETLLAAKKLADGMGGVDKAREALALLAKLS
jgi:hypothetical protein